MLPLTAYSPESSAAVYGKLQECGPQIARNLGWRMEPELAQEWHTISAGETH